MTTYIPQLEPLREPMLIIEGLLIVIMIEIGLIYLRKIMRDRGTSTNNMLKAWAQFIFCYAAVFTIYIIADFYAPLELRAEILNISYTIAVLGAALFAYQTEREIQMKHFFSIVMFALACCIVLNAIFWFLSTSVYITLVTWLIFIVLIIFYIKRFTDLVPDKWRLNAYSLVLGIILVILGFGGNSDFMVNLLGVGIRLISDLLIILGMVFISILFIGVPSLAEFEWWTKIKYLTIMSQSGLSIAHFRFNQDKDKDTESFDDLLMAGGLTSLSQVISSMVQSEKKLDSVDQGALKLLFQYGKYLISVLVVSAPLVILRSKLKKVTETLEMLYQEDLAHWDGDLTRFQLLEQVVNVHFTAKAERKVGGE